MSDNATRHHTQPQPHRHTASHTHTATRTTTHLRNHPCQLGYACKLWRDTHSTGEHLKPHSHTATHPTHLPTEPWLAHPCPPARPAHAAHTAEAAVWQVPHAPSPLVACHHAGPCMPARQPCDRGWGCTRGVTNARATAGHSHASPTPFRRPWSPGHVDVDAEKHAQARCAADTQPRGQHRRTRAIER